jgi:hypothetical protein
MKRRSAILLPSAALLAAGGGLLGYSSPAEAQLLPSRVTSRLVKGDPTLGEPFSPGPIYQGSRVQQLQIYADRIVIGIRTTLLNWDRSTKQFGPYGKTVAPNGNPVAPTVLNFGPGEIITKIDTFYGDVGLVGVEPYTDFEGGGVEGILGLRIRTNFSSYQQIGLFKEGSGNFQYNAPRSYEIIGFNGAFRYPGSDVSMLAAIGVVIRRIGR